MVDEISSDIFELFRSAIEGNVDDYAIEILNNEKGEGFIGEIIFVTFINKTTREKTSLLVKREQMRNGRTVEKFTEMCKNEVYFYDVIWPSMKKYYRDVSKTELNFVPKCFGTSNTERAQIVLENIRPQGFVCHDKTTPFDDDHCRLIFKTYGIYHGVSMALREKDNEQYKRLINGKTNNFKKALEEEEFFCKSFIDRVQDAQGYFDPVQDKPILEKLRLYEESGVQMFLQCLNEDYPNEVILHGDCWSNNMMFKYDDQGKPQEVKLIDFQLVCHGPPVFDLSYCLYTGACEETLSKLEDYFEVYHSSLSDTLKEFDLEAEIIYPLKTFKEDWKKCCKYGFFLGIFLWKMKLLLKDDIPDLTGNVSKIRHVKLSDDGNEEYAMRIKELVTHMYINDYF